MFRRAKKTKKQSDRENDGWTSANDGEQTPLEAMTLCNISQYSGSEIYYPLSIDNQETSNSIASE